MINDESYRVLWNNLQESFFKLSTKLFKADKESLWQIDFDKPWWYIYWEKKFYLLPGLSMEIIYSIIRVILPLVVSYSFEKKAYLVLIYFILFRMILGFIAWIAYRSWVIFVEILPVSIRFSANKFFLTTDPINHSTRNSGQIVSKIGRTEESSRQLVLDFTWDLVNLISSLIATVVGFYFIDFKIGTVLVLSLIILIGMSVIDNSFRSSIYQVKKIPVEDKVRSVELENLQQTSYIKSLFATKTQVQKFDTNALKLMNLNYSSWRSGGIMWQIITTFYYLISLFLVLFLINQVGTNSISVVTAIALISTFLIGTGNILQAGNIVQSLTRSIISIQDLFDFIKEYGKGSYPVLDQKNER